MLSLGRWSLVVRSWSGARAALRRVKDIESQLTRLSDSELRRRSLSLRYRACSGVPLGRLLPEAYALMREACRRSLQMRHYDVQILGGIALHARSVVEMQTGEGKTLTATLPLYLCGLMGRGAHLATANDYLARRDADTVRPAYALLGMSVGVIQSDTSSDQRRQAYRCDITYAAAREYGFDFLRDRLAAANSDETGGQLLARMLGQAQKRPTDSTVQRELYFALVDEADSILIDEARTPLIVSSLPGDAETTVTAGYRWAADVAPQFVDSRDFDYDHKRRAVTLNACGRRRVRELPRPDELAEMVVFDSYVHVERAIRALRDFHRDQQYVVREDEIVIVDENTGRLAEGRKWRDGLHQAIEAKEGVEVTFKTGEAARVTVQDFFRQYQRLGGMTGTAWTSRRELRRIYQLRTRVIPTHRAEQRKRLPDLVFADELAKWQAVVREVDELHRAGRPVLIGTRSIDKSELLSSLLRQANIRHEVLNAHRHADEAKIVATAGEPGKVTVATNMAGRGTDIKLADEVRGLGGLHVICTELHDSPRIDRQLIGRCARQGDPGSFRQFLALDDAIVRFGLGPQVAERFEQVKPSGRGSLKRYARVLRRAQNRVERAHFRQRCLLLYHEKQRRQVQREMGQDPYLDSVM